MRRVIAAHTDVDDVRATAEQLSGERLAEFLDQTMRLIEEDVETIVCEAVVDFVAIELPAGDECAVLAWSPLVGKDLENVRKAFV